MLHIEIVTDILMTDPSVINTIDAQLIETAICGSATLDERLIMQSDCFHTNTVYKHVHIYIPRVNYNSDIIG